MVDGEKSNDMKAQQFNYGGAVQGIPVGNEPTAPSMTSSSSNYTPPPQYYPPASEASAYSTKNPPPPLHQIPEKPPIISNINTPTGTASSTATGGNAIVIVNPGPPVVVKDDSLPCGCGSGWLMFIFGWFFAIPWYVGACILICGKIDRREKPGHIACAVMAVICTIIIIVAVVH